MTSPIHYTTIFWPNMSLFLKGKCSTVILLGVFSDQMKD